MAVVADGKILLHLERERDSRERHAHWMSADLIHDALAYCGLTAADVDLFALSATQSTGYGTDTPERLRFDYAWQTAEQLGTEAFHRPHFERATAAAVQEPHADEPALSRLRNSECPEMPDAWLTGRGMLAIDDVDGRLLERLFSSPVLASSHALPMTVTLDGRVFPAVGVLHQAAHAAAAFFQSPFGTAPVLAFDNGMPIRSKSGFYGGGMLFYGDGSTIRPVWSAPLAAGVIYSQSSRKLNLGAFSGPGKLMGLSAYGTPRFHDPAFVGDIAALAGRYLHPEPGNSVIYGWLKAVEDRANALGYRFDGEPFGPFGKDLAASAQKSFEDLVLYALDRLRVLLEKTGRMGPELCLSGGCALNCPTNSRIVEDTPFSSVFVPPSCDDGGLSIGAALYLHHHILGHERTGSADLGRNIAALGRAASPAAVARALEGCAGDFRIDRDVDLAERAAEDLAADRVVALFQGRSESGPRALGHRSLLADPRRAGNWERVNHLKSRELWRPFAPACLAERMHQHFEGGPQHSPHMLFNYRVRSRDLGAVTHVDGSARVQTVAPGSGAFRDILEAFERRTGTPVVLNTSLNGPGEPIVETPEQAIDLVRRTGIDVLYIEGNRLQIRRPPEG
ncbi:MAG: carbamoyltransferase C-terminal domain-containing protein [Thalassobaculum sp.]|uniref:carbamoyltransferase C-terminal domain-containing protein n=1 Tax=Thalassobaculum sp. TaxID=2022740 RepID=UPI0032F060C2